ncbi:MAG: hypothetical protein LUH04_01055 [Clostridium sp.]|nr:hypothetical protein [Clostridium sp.]
MSRNSGNIRYSERRPYDSGRNPRLDRERRATRKRRRRNRLVKGLIAWAVCILLVVLVALGTMRVVGSMSTSKQRELRTSGIEKMEAGDFAGAITDFDQALAVMDKDTGEMAVDVLRYRAEAEYRLEDYEAAYYSYKLLMDRDAKNLEYWYMASMCSAAMGDVDQAVELYDYVQRTEAEAKKKTEGRLNALLAAGAACVKTGGYDRAMSLYENALRDGLDDGKIYIQMGLCQMAEENYKDAADTFDKGKVKAQEDRELLKELSYNRAVCSEYLYKYDEALKLFEEYNKSFGPDERAEHEITFLKSR